MKSCVTISLVPEVRGGPFVFWDDLITSCQRASRLGFDAVEIFPAAADAFDPESLQRTLSDNGLRLAAVGTGAGWVKQKLTLTDPDSRQRHKASQFVRSLIDVAGPLGAPAIIGSMQGRSSPADDRSEAMRWLAESLSELSEYAASYGVSLLYEPLNRYETDLCNTFSQALDLLHRSSIDNVGLLADLFHMNIEERSIPDAIRAAGARIRHVHFVDSNRQPAGCGHTDFGPIADALREIGYDRFLSAEALPMPDSETAARLTIDSFRRHFA
jgi:sugar phosphate isomerase/epimerase